MIYSTEENTATQIALFTKKVMQFYYYCGFHPLIIQPPARTHALLAADATVRYGEQASMLL